MEEKWKRLEQLLYLDLETKSWAESDGPCQHRALQSVGQQVLIRAAALDPAACCRVLQPSCRSFLTSTRHLHVLWLRSSKTRRPVPCPRAPGGSAAGARTYACVSVLLAAHVLRRAQPSHQCLGCLQPLPGACVPRAGAGGDPAHRAHAGGGQPWCPGACCRRCCCAEADEDGQAGGRSPMVAAPAVPATACARENVVLWQKQTASVTSADGVLPWLRAGRARSPMPCLWLCSWPCSPEGSGALRVS